MNSYGKDFPRFIVMCLEAAMRNFQIYSDGRVWGGYSTHVELVVESVVTEKAMC